MLPSKNQPDQIAVSGGYALEIFSGCISNGLIAILDKRAQSLTGQTHSLIGVSVIALRFKHKENRILTITAPHTLKIEMYIRNNSSIIISQLIKFHSENRLPPDEDHLLY